MGGFHNFSTILVSLVMKLPIDLPRQMLKLRLLNRNLRLNFLFCPRTQIKKLLEGRNIDYAAGVGCQKYSIGVQPI